MQLRGGSLVSALGSSCPLTFQNTQEVFHEPASGGPRCLLAAWGDAGAGRYWTGKAHSLDACCASSLARSLHLCLTLRAHGLKPARLLCPWDSPGKNTGVGCHALLQGIFPTQGSSPHLLRLLHWQVSSLALAPLGRRLLLCSLTWASFLHPEAPHALHL